MLGCLVFAGVPSDFRRGIFLSSPEHAPHRCLVVSIELECRPYLVPFEFMYKVEDSSVFSERIKRGGGAGGCGGGG